MRDGYVELELTSPKGAGEKPCNALEPESRRKSLLGPNTTEMAKGQEPVEIR